MKVTKHKPDQFLMEYEHFFPLLSYYLPVPALKENNDFVEWMRNTKGLSE